MPTALNYLATSIGTGDKIEFSFWSTVFSFTRAGQVAKMRFAKNVGLKLCICYKAAQFDDIGLLIGDLSQLDTQFFTFIFTKFVIVRKSKIGAELQKTLLLYTFPQDHLLSKCPWVRLQSFEG